MADVLTVIDGMSGWVKGAWLVWLAWLAIQIAWYRWGRLGSSEKVASAAAPPQRLDVSRFAPVDKAPHHAADASHALPSGPRRRRRARRAAAVATNLADGVEAAR